MTIPERLAALRKRMAEEGIDAYYIPSSDAHQSEYLPKYAKTREYISGFTGSAGTAVVTKDKALLWTDGRYFLQAEQQLHGSGFELCKMGEPGVPSIEEFFQHELRAGDTLGLDGKVTAAASYRQLKDCLPAIRFVADKDLVGSIWNDRPEPRYSTAYILEQKYTGKSVKEKLSEVRALLAEKKCDATVIGALEDICWLYNIRGSDVKSNPVLTSYAIIEKTQAKLFIDPRQMPKDVEEALRKEGVDCYPYEAVFEAAAKLDGVVFIDPSRTNIYLRNCIQAKMLEGINLTSILKAVKNETELKSIRNAMLKDGVAMVQIIKWIEENADARISECDVADKLLEFRAAQKDFIEASFGTISGYGANGAIIHYAPRPETCATLEPKGFLLLDSGGQYRDGTTDITRTIQLGPLTEEEREDYTLVLKSHIQLAIAQFKAGTPGYVLDGIARLPLWKAGKDYKHGTGHGVGFVLSVHEGPQSISNRYTINVPLEPGMVTSNEPGMYVAGSHGIRIENLTVTQVAIENEYGPFYSFETVTLCPIDTRPVIKSLLLPEELAWLNNYHKLVQEKLSPLLDAEHQAFLAERCKAL